MLYCSYTLTAVATDNGGASTTSVGVNPCLSFVRGFQKTSPRPLEN